MFFTSNIRNKNTRRNYYKAACRFAERCEGRGVRDLADVKPMHVAYMARFQSFASARVFVQNPTEVAEFRDASLEILDDESQ
jgi:hypothetical protein